MDNGQSGGNTKKNPTFSGVNSEEPAFFTPGVGNESPENNNIEPEINLDEENWQKALETSTPAGMPTPEQISPKTELESLEQSSEPKMPSMGEVVPFPTQATPPIQSTASVIANSINQGLPSTRIVEGRFNGTPKVDQTIAEFNQTEDTNNFYDEIRGQANPNSLLDETLGSFDDRVIGNHAKGAV